MKSLLGQFRDPSNILCPVVGRPDSTESSRLNMCPGLQSPVFYVQKNQFYRFLPPFRKHSYHLTSGLHHLPPDSFSWILASFHSPCYLNCLMEASLSTVMTALTWPPICKKFCIAQEPFISTWIRSGSSMHMLKDIGGVV